MKSKSRNALGRILACLLGTHTAMALCWLASPVKSRFSPPERSNARWEVEREKAIREVMSSTDRIWDTHSDSQVGRVGKANLVAVACGKQVELNSLGLREREFKLPKPPGSVRVAMLGDSFTFGQGVDQTERMGSVLERELIARTQSFERNIECLHLGVSSWNIHSEAAYLRRQLHILQPDLVVHQVFMNDLEDSFGVRGFATQAKFATAARQRADSLYRITQKLGGQTHDNLIPYALDWESKRRYSACADELADLADSVESSGARYLCLVIWPTGSSAARKHLTHLLRPDQVTYVSNKIQKSSQYWVSRSDQHWNAAAHKRVATMLYGMIRKRALLPMLELSTWSEADAELQEIAETGLAQADLQKSPSSNSIGGNSIRSHIEFPLLELEDCKHLVAGMDSSGRFGRYASLLLARRDATALTIEGEHLGRDDLGPGNTLIFADEFELGSIPLRGHGNWTLHSNIPNALLERDHLNIRFQSDNFVYDLPDLRRLTSQRITQVSLE